MVIRSRFHGCDIRTCVGESKMSYNLVNIGLLTQGDSFVDKISSNTDSEKPVDVTEINELEMLVKLHFRLG